MGQVRQLLYVSLQIIQKEKVIFDSVLGLLSIQIQNQMMFSIRTTVHIIMHICVTIALQKSENPNLSWSRCYLNPSFLFWVIRSSLLVLTLSSCESGCSRLCCWMAMGGGRGTESAPSSPSSSPQLCMPDELDLDSVPLDRPSLRTLWDARKSGGGEIMLPN